MADDPKWPDDFITREDAAKLYQVSVIQLRRMAQRGEIRNYRRGNLRTIWLNRAEVAAALRLHIVMPDEDTEDSNEDEA